MAKKKKPTEKKVKAPKKEQEEPKEDHGGFPEGIDFKKFLGCGG